MVAYPLVAGDGRRFSDFPFLLPTETLLMSDRSALLRKYSDAAMEQLMAFGNDASLLEEPYRTVAIVQATQGVIDNGGLIFFFESDWPGQPPYRLFSDAYRRLGKQDAADDIDAAAASFGIDQPEKHRELRQAFMDTRFETEDENGDDVEGLYEVTWKDRILGDDTVWNALADWVELHSAGIAGDTAPQANCQGPSTA